MSKQLILVMALFHFWMTNIMKDLSGDGGNLSSGTTNHYPRSVGVLHGEMKEMD